MAFNTGNPVPSNKAEDLSDNAENLDSAVNSTGATWTDRLGVTRQTVIGATNSIDAASTQGLIDIAQDVSDVEASADAFDVLALDRVNKIGVVYDSPIRDWSASLLVDDLRAHRYPATTGDIYIPKKALPFTTGATFEPADWNLLQGITDADIINDLSQTYYCTKAEYEALTFTFPVGKTVHLNDRDADFKVIAGTGTATGYKIIASNSVSQSLDLAEYGASVIARHWGAIAEDPSGATATLDNSGALQAAWDYACSLGLFLDVSDSIYRYTTTLDVTSFRTAKIRGNCDDKNNVGKYNLFFDGAGYAIAAKGLIHDKLGLKGTLATGSAITTGRFAFNLSESVTHLNSCIKNFKKAYNFTGGYYHKIQGGTIRNCTDIYDFTAFALYNFEISETQHTGYVNGVIANGGDGPLNIGGSWERAAGPMINSTAGEPEFPINFKGAYFENPTDGTVNVHPGLTSDDADYYQTNNIALLSRQSVSGALVVYTKGLTQAIRWGFFPAYIDLSGAINHDGEACSFYVVAGAEIGGTYLDHKMETKLSSVGLTIDSSTPQRVSGQFIDTDNKMKTKGTETNGSLTNGWAKNSSVTNSLVISKNGDHVDLKMGLDGSSATGDIITTLSAGLRPKETVQVIIYDGAGATERLTISTNGEVSSASRYIASNFTVTYKTI